MYVFTLLGMIMDGLMNDELEVLSDGGYAEITIEDTDIIDRYIMPLCDDDEEERREVIDGGSWYQTTLIFGKNRRGEGEIQIVRFENSVGDAIDCEVGDHIISELATNYMLLDRLYHQICDEIMY